MSQNRIHFSGYRPELLRAQAKIETEFEDDGLPIALTEVDEAADLVELSIYAEAEDTEAVKARIRDCLGSDGFGLTMEVEILPDIDWVSESLKGLAPVRVGRFIVHGSHDRDAVSAGLIGLEIEAGQAFGTGHHGTTSGCLAAIEDVLKAGWRPGSVLDLGAGSAVLAIAVARLIGVPVLATDIDPIAVDVALDNAELNGVGHLIEGVTATGFASPAIRARAPFDLIIANILAGPLIELAPQMRENAAPGARIILSGILDHQANRVAAAYRSQGFIKKSAAFRGEWATLQFVAP